MSKILAIDLGTTYFKFTLFDRGGRLCECCRIEPPTVADRPGILEMPPDGFLAAIQRGIAEIGNRVKGDLSDVEAVTFATQTNSFLLLDANHHPLTPIILWPDRRAETLEAEVCNRASLAEFSATTGIPRMNHQFMLAKLLWTKKKSPEIEKQTNKLCLISDYLTFLLTGMHVTEAGAAGLTGMLDIHRCQWWPAMLDRFEIDGGLLPTVVRAGTDLGQITVSAAQRFGLPVTCRFVVGCLDQYAGAMGTGNVEPGMLSETTGTVLATVQCADHFSTQLGSDVFQGPAFREGLFWRMAFCDISANYLQWYRNQLPDRPDFETLSSLAEPIVPGAEGLRLRTDVGLANLDRVFVGLTPQHTRGHAVRCIMEAVAVALNNQTAALSDGSAQREIRCAGGAARSDVWMQIKADVLGAATIATQCSEPTSLGAAMLAEAAITGADVCQVARQWSSLKAPHHPDAPRHALYRTLFPEIVP